MTQIRKKIIVVGGSGTIGKAIVKELNQRHEVISVGHHSGQHQVDITDASSIQQMYRQIGQVDAVISAAGKVQFAPLAEMDSESYQFGLNDKLMGQINLVLLGMDFIKQGGSFTLISGILNHDPIVCGSSAAMVNGAIEGFVKTAALELPRAIRINCVSPTILEESMSLFQDFFHGYKPVPAAEAALAYSKSVEGMQTGQIYRVGYSLI